MQKRKSAFPVFIVLLIVSLLFFVLSGVGVLKDFTGFLENVTIPLQKTVFDITRVAKNDQSELARLKEENNRLAGQIVAQKEMEREIAALRGQFQTTFPVSRTLLPSRVIGLTGGKLIIDKGSSDKLKKGNVVVLSENLVGQVERVSAHQSLVSLITRDGVSFTSKSLNTASLGVIKGQNGGLVLDNVILAEKLEKGELVVTNGDVDEKGIGLPPGLVVGRIDTVNKKASNLFQSAEVESLVDFGRLETVFVIITDN